MLLPSTHGSTPPKVGHATERFILTMLTGRLAPHSVRLDLLSPKRSWWFGSGLGATAELYMNAL